MADQKHYEFWMVYGMGQRAPAAEHVTRDRAVDEARRLARAHPGTTFYVLHAERGYVMAPPPITEVEIDPEEIPF